MEHHPQLYFQLKMVTMLLVLEARQVEREQALVAQAVTVLREALPLVMEVEEAAQQEMEQMEHCQQEEVMADCQKNQLLLEFLQFIQTHIGQQVVLEDIYQAIHMQVQVRDHMDIQQAKAYL